MMEVPTPGVVVIAVTVGAFLGFLTVRWGVKHTAESKKFAKRPETRLWFALAATSCGLSLGVAAMLAPTWWPLFSGRHVAVQVLSVALVVALYLAALLGPRRASGSPPAEKEETASRIQRVLRRLLAGPDYPLYRHYTRMAVLFAIAFIALGMALSGMILVALDARADVPLDAASFTDEEGTLLHALELRRALQLFLGACALLIAAAIVVTAALRRALVAHSPTYRMPAMFLLLYGGFFSGLLAAVYFPSFMALQDAAWQIVTVTLEKSQLNPPDPDWFTLRTNLIDALSLEFGVVKTFAGAFAVLTPIASAYLTNFLTDSGPRAADVGIRSSRPGSSRSRYVSGTRSRT